MPLPAMHLQPVQTAVKMANAPRFVIARPQRGRGALSAKREEVPLGCNLAVPGRIMGKLSAKTQLPSRDCHVGLRLPRNDKLGGHCLFNIGPHFPPVQCRARLSPPLQCTAESLVQLSTFHSRLSTSIPLFLYI